jgi:diadenosine tetraphosphate (Ap4A) HIT family hydrolase
MNEFIGNDEYSFVYETDEKFLDAVSSELMSIVKETFIKTIVKTKYERTIYMIPTDQTINEPAIIRIPKRRVDIYKDLSKLVDSYMQEEVKEYGKDLKVMSSKVITIEAN